MTIRGHVENGQVILDQLLPLPDRSRVEVIVNVVADGAAEPRSHWQQLKSRLQAKPIHGGGRRFTRDELHERG